MNNYFSFLAISCAEKYAFIKTRPNPYTKASLYLKIKICVRDTEIDLSITNVKDSHSRDCASRVRETFGCCKTKSSSPYIGTRFVCCAPFGDTSRIKNEATAKTCLFKD